MYLSDPVVQIIYDSGRTYHASIETQTNRIRLFEEKPNEDAEVSNNAEIIYDCFSAFNAKKEDGTFMTIKEIVEKCDSIITSYNKEKQNSITRYIKNNITEYPPS